MRVEQLTNGLRLVLKENQSKNLIALCGYVNGGGRTEDDTIKGLSHYYEHIIFRGGTARQAELETRRAFQALGDYGGYTSDDATCYYFTTPKENFSEALWRYSDALMNLEVTAEKIEKDRQSIIQEYHMSVSDKPWGLAYHNLRRAAYYQHPYKVDPIGLEPVIRNAQLETFRTFYEERYVPNQITLAVVGDFQSDAMIEAIEGAFGGYVRGRDSFELANAEIPNNQLREVGSRLKTELAYFYLGFHLQPARSGEMAALSVLARLLGSARASRLEVALKQRELIAQTVLGFLEMRKDDSMFTIAVDLKPENQRRALEVIAEELSKVVNEPVPENELERTKRLIENSYYSHYESFQNRAQGLCWYSVVSDVYEMERWLAAIRAVSCEDVQRVAAQYLRWENATLSTVAPVEVSIEDYQNLLLERLPRAGGQAAKEAKSERIVNFTLPCGARVLFKPESGSGRFAARALVGGGQLIEPAGEAGVNHFVAQLSLRGTARASREELAREMAELGLDIHATSMEDYVEFSLSCAAAVKEKALRLFCEILEKPLFSADGIEKLRAEILTDISAIGDDSFALTGHEFNRVLYGEHPYSHLIHGKKETVECLSAEQLRAFHERAYCGTNLLFAMAGEAEPAELERELSALTTEWCSGSAPTIAVHDPGMPLHSSQNGLHLIEKESKQVTFNWGRLALAATDGNTLALQLATSIIGYRLFYRQVYEKGIAYRMWTLMPMRRARAPFYFQMGVAPENFQHARDGISSEVERFLREPIPQAEFERAQATLIQRYFLAQTTCSAQASTLGRYTFYGFDSNFLENYSERIRVISRAEVEEVAREHIKLGDMALVAVGAF